MLDVSLVICDVLGDVHGCVVGQDLLLLELELLELGGLEHLARAWRRGLASWCGSYIEAISPPELVLKTIRPATMATRATA
jgi:hypothetical protein